MFLPCGLPGANLRVDRGEPGANLQPTCGLIAGRKPMVFTLFCFFLKSYVCLSKMDCFDAGINAGSLGPTCGLIAGRKPNGFHTFLFFFNIVFFCPKSVVFCPFIDAGINAGTNAGSLGPTHTFQILFKVVCVLSKIECFLSFLLMRPTCGLIAGKKPNGFHTSRFFQYPSRGRY